MNRAGNGYRIYTEKHVTYFECIRAMNTGFGMKLVRKVMPLIQKNNVTDALWLVNDIQVNLPHERRKVDQALRALEREELEQFPAPNQTRMVYNW